MDEPALTGLELRRESTAEQAASLLRAQIFAGRLRAGTHLREAQLSSTLGVSRNTMREAIQILVREGLVTRNMHRGAFVARLEPADVHDLYRVRRLVELAALRYAARAGTDLSELELAVAGLAAAVERGDRTAIVEEDLRFHKALVRTMDSPRLESLFDAVEVETRLCLTLIDQSYPEPGILVEEHEGVLQALRAHDEVRSVELLRGHLDDAEEVIVRLLPHSTTSATPAVP
jgi:DNA-binding GntR family transcriptional regulator